MGFFSNMSRNLQVTREIQAAKEETIIRFRDHLLKHETELSTIINICIKEELEKFLIVLNESYPNEYKKLNNIKDELERLYREMGVNGFEEGCLDPNGSRKKMWDGEIKIKVLMDEGSIFNEKVIKEFVRIGRYVYIKSNDFGEERSLPQNFTINRW